MFGDWFFNVIKFTVCFLKSFNWTWEGGQCSGRGSFHWVPRCSQRLQHVWLGPVKSLPIGLSSHNLEPDFSFRACNPAKAKIPVRSPSYFKNQAPLNSWPLINLLISRCFLLLLLFGGVAKFLFIVCWLVWPLFSVCFELFFLTWNFIVLFSLLLRTRLGGT